MPRLPSKLIVFLIAFGFFWIYLGPKRAELAKKIIRGKRAAVFEDSIKVLVESKIRENICSWNDMCSYRPHSWEGLRKVDDYSAEAVHQFFTDDQLRKFLFRVRHHEVSEVIDLR